MNTAGLGPEGQRVLPARASVGEKHHHKLWRKQGAGLGPVRVRDPRTRWAPGRWKGGGGMGRRLTVKVYGAIPVEVHFSEHLIQLGTHQRLPQQSWCCLSQLCHGDPSISVPVKLGFQQGSAPPTQSWLCLNPSLSCHIPGLDAPTCAHPNPPPLPKLGQQAPCSRKSPWADPPAERELDLLQPLPGPRPPICRAVGLQGLNPTPSLSGPDGRPAGLLSSHPTSTRLDHTPYLSEGDAQLPHPQHVRRLLPQLWAHQFHKLLEVHAATHCGPRQSVTVERAGPQKGRRKHHRCQPLPSSASGKESSASKPLGVEGRGGGSPALHGDYRARCSGALSEVRKCGGRSPRFGPRQLQVQTLPRLPKGMALGDS